jgi:hypothetical protein
LRKLDVDSLRIKPSLASNLAEQFDQPAAPASPAAAEAAGVTINIAAGASVTMVFNQDRPWQRPT